MSKEFWAIIGVGVANGLLVVALGTLMVSEHASLRDDMRLIQTQLNDVDRRVARIEGRLFGLEAPEKIE